jgi:hypothetical protein
MFLQAMPDIRVEANGRKVLFNGGSIACSADVSQKEVRVYINDEFLGIGWADSGRLKITTLLVEE